MAYLVFDEEMTPFDGEEFNASYNEVAYVYENLEDAQGAIKEWAIDQDECETIVKFYEVTPTSARLVGSYRVECVVTMTECEE